MFTKITQALTLLLPLSFSTLALAETEELGFVCPNEEGFISTWAKAVANAEAVAANDLLAADRERAYDHFFPKFIPNHNLLLNSVTIEDVEYDLSVVRGNFLSNENYPDAYGVLFQKGTSIAVARLKSDTDRSDFQCQGFLAPTQVLSADEFLSLTIDSPQGIVVKVKDIAYENFYVISSELAYGENEKNEFVQFVPAK